MKNPENCISRLSLAINRLLQAYGVDISRSRSALRSTPLYLADLIRFIWLSKQSSYKLSPKPKITLYPCLTDKSDTAGTFSGDYVNQDLYYSQKIFDRSPAVHLDIGSRFDGFITHLLSFKQNVLIGDIRPLNLPPFFQAQYIQVDITSNSSFAKRTYESVSCLHVIEHLGLGRYGDPLDLKGYRTGIANLARLLDPVKGILYLSFPSGPNHLVEFNGQHILAMNDVLSIFTDNSLSIVDYAYVSPQGNIVVSDDYESLLEQSRHLSSQFCALFTLRKHSYSA